MRSGDLNSSEGRGHSQKLPFIQPYEKSRLFEMSKFDVFRLKFGAVCYIMAYVIFLEAFL